MRDPLLWPAIKRATTLDGDLQQYPPVGWSQAGANLVNSLAVSPGDVHSPDEVFDRVRWGGQVIFATADGNQARRLSQQYANAGFDITQDVTKVVVGPLGLTIPFFSRSIYFFVARKVHLIQPGQVTDRFTYHVYLQKEPAHGQYVVVKEVPSLEQLATRLRSKWPDLPVNLIEKRARKFADKIFPTFLTREAAILKIVNRDLPEEYRGRVPSVLSMEQDERGYVRKLSMNWLRIGGEPLTQVEFARQSADLLRVLHDDVGVMHLDLRLDNIVITPRGVCFVDFGSAVRVDENLRENPLLSNLFEELMRTSEIQRMLFSMTRTGQVTSEAISRGLHKVDKAVDYFYLAVQIAAPHTNPELRELILYDKKSRAAQQLQTLTDQILRPKDPARPVFCSAADILHGIEEIQNGAASKRATA